MAENRWVTGGYFTPNYKWKVMGPPLATAFPGPKWCRNAWVWLIQRKCCFTWRAKGIAPETNIAPENRPLEKEIPIGNRHFQGLWLLVSGRVGVFCGPVVFPNCHVNISPRMELPCLSLQQHILLLHYPCHLTRRSWALDSIEWTWLQRKGCRMFFFPVDAIMVSVHPFLSSILKGEGS